MSDQNSLKETVVEEVTEQVDPSDLLGSGSIEEEVDAREIGTSVGREMGGRIGRQLGEEIGANVQDAIASGLESDRSLTEILADVKRSIVEAVKRTLSDLEASDTVQSVTNAIPEDSLPDDQLRDVAPGDTLESNETDEQAEQGEVESEVEEVVAAEPDASDLEGLKRETLEDFLEIMSYRDLQSVAKEVDVRANLSRDEMTDQIIETVAETGA